MRDDYIQLLHAWADGILEYQIEDERHPELHGAILCPACSVIHGRCHDAVYPLMCMAKLSGEEKYLSAAKHLFDWAQCMVCDDGSVYNDSQSAWNGITVFAAIGLANALHYHSALLSAEEKARWEKRLRGMGNWLLGGITKDTKTNINYIATNAAAMAILSRYFHDDAYASAARALAEFALSHITENGLIAGEGRPTNAPTPRGCLPVDVGYNVEETLPSLYEYATAMKDDIALEAVLRAARAHLALMLPDGAWDNSFGTRTFKWTYWGSRTSDGCQALFNALGKREPMFAEAAYRNLKLYARCTKNNLMYGGPDYAAHGEKPCVHHAFCHAKVLAQALDEGVCEFARTDIPSDHPPVLARYPEIDTCRAASGDWRMTVTGGDFHYMNGGHASGGTITLLWHRRWGAVLATANTDYSMHEPHNQQLSRNKSAHRSLCPRVEMTEDNVRYAQCYDTASDIRANASEGGASFDVACALVSPDGKTPARRVVCRMNYLLTPDGLTLSGRVSAGGAQCAKLILPLIASDADAVSAGAREVAIARGDAVLKAESKSAIQPSPERIFNLAPGLEALELVALPDEEGRFCVTIRVQ